VFSVPAVIVIVLGPAVILMVENLASS